MTSCNSILRLVTAAALMIATLSAQTAYAESCTYDPFLGYKNDPRYADTSDQAQNDADRWFNVFHCAPGSSPTHGTIGRFYWDKFGFVSDYWDEGFGWDN